jgi:hypothetical protein
VESGGPSVGKVGECDVESRHLKGCSPRLYRLRTNGLVSVSKYWTYWSHVRDMGPISLVAGRQQKVGFASHCFNVCLWRETGYRPVDWSFGVLWIVSGDIFLGSNGPAQLCWWLCERLLCVDHVGYICSRTIHRLSVGCVWRVGQVSPAGCISIRIVATLGYE